MASDNAVAARSVTDEAVEIWHIEGRRSFRLAWLCEELDIPYELKFVEGDIFSSWRSIVTDYPSMPLSPVARLNGRWIAETGGIIEAILARAGKGQLIPDVASKDFVSHCQWMHFAEGTMAALMAKTRYIAEASGIPVDQLPRGYRRAEADKQIDPSNPLEFLVGMGTVFDFIEQHLQTHRYFGGTQFTAADIMMHFPIQLSEIVVWMKVDAYPAVARWYAEVESRPAFQRARATTLPRGGDKYGQPLNTPHPFTGPNGQSS